MERFLRTLLVLTSFVIITAIFYLFLPIVMAAITIVLAVGYIIFSIIGVFHLLKK